MTGSLAWSGSGSRSGRATAGGQDLPARLANPVWVDDRNFDLTYHVRRSALPRPGTDEQLEEFVARVQPRPLDRTRPLWEVYLVEGLQYGRFAVVTQTHQALVDGVHALDIGHLLVSSRARGDRLGRRHPGARPRRRTTSSCSAGPCSTRCGPGRVVEAVREGFGEVREAGSRAADGLGRWPRPSRAWRPARHRRARSTPRSARPAGS